jgi:hypothetical protein
MRNQGRLKARVARGKPGESGRVADELFQAIPEQPIMRQEALQIQLQRFDTKAQDVGPRKAARDCWMTALVPIPRFLA